MRLLVVRRTQHLLSRALFDDVAVQHDGDRVGHGADNAHRLFQAARRFARKRLSATLPLLAFRRSPAVCGVEQPLSVKVGAGVSDPGLKGANDDV